MNPTIDILIAGASGFIGSRLIPELLTKFPNAQITALSRIEQTSHHAQIKWVACDLFSLKSLEESVPEKVDLAFYLVHSMGPTAQLDQGSFADYDLLLADNFARILATKNPQQLIYLGGLIPESIKLSLHLQSRLEVEETFAQYRLPMTVFRAGLILGRGGSSFQILLKLVKRLPVMVCPHWTQTETTPVGLDSVIDALATASLDQRSFHKIYDLADCEPMTYMEMMKETAKAIGTRRLFLSVPFFTPTLSRLWVSLITNTPKNLVYPLVESLRHPMVARNDHSFFSAMPKKNFIDLLNQVSLKTVAGRSPFRFQAQRKTVRSVQRLPLPVGKNAEWVLSQYYEWLPGFLFPLVKVIVDGPMVAFCLATKHLQMLQMTFHSERSNKDRQLLYLNGGLLVTTELRGRLEFRVVLNRKYVLAAIHNYKPALPWFIYKYTQAKIHLIVMKSFAQHLAKAAK